MDRRTLLRLLLAAPIAATVDVERLLWLPKPIVTVPAMPLAFHPDAFAMAMDPLRIGDVFTMKGYYRMNPRTRESTDYLVEWVVIERV